MALTARLLVTILSISLALTYSLAISSETQSKEPTKTGGGMIMEHINMDCSNCHGKDGPKGMMMEHEGIQCMVCHEGASDAGRPMIRPKSRGGALSQKMMLEHKGVVCTSCHSEGGPTGMMLEHENIECSVCHPMAHE